MKLAVSSYSFAKHLKETKCGYLEICNIAKKIGSDAIEDMAPISREVDDCAEKKGIKTCSENRGFIFRSPERVEDNILAVKAGFAYLKARV